MFFATDVIIFHVDDIYADICTMHRGGTPSHARNARKYACVARRWSPASRAPPEKRMAQCVRGANAPTGRGGVRGCSGAATAAAAASSAAGPAPAAPPSRSLCASATEARLRTVCLTTVCSRLIQRAVLEPAATLASISSEENGVVAANFRKRSLANHKDSCLSKSLDLRRPAFLHAHLRARLGLIPPGPPPPGVERSPAHAALRARLGDFYWETRRGVRLIVVTHGEITVTFRWFGPAAGGGPRPAWRVVLQAGDVLSMTGVAAGSEPHPGARLPVDAALPPHHPDVLPGLLRGQHGFVLTHSLSGEGRYFVIELLARWDDAAV